MSEYSVFIQYDPVDEIFVVSIPELPGDRNGKGAVDRNGPGRRPDDTGAFAVQFYDGLMEING